MTTDSVRLQLVITADPRQVQTALRSLGHGLQNLKTQSVGLTSSWTRMGPALLASMRGLLVGGAAVAGAVVAGAAGLKHTADTAAATAGEVEMLSRMLGLSTNKASELRAGAQLLGVEFNTLQGAIQTMLGNLKSLNAADNPFRILGIQVVNAKGQMRDFDAILSETLNKLQRMGPTGAREMFASKIFGGATPELLRMIDAGGEGLKKAAESARAMGLILSPQQIQAAIQYRTAVRQLGQAWEGIKTTIGNAVMPVLTNLARFLAQWAQTTLPKLKAELSPVINLFRGLGHAVSGLASLFATIYRSFMDWSGAGQRVQMIGKGLREVFNRIGMALKEFGEWLTRVKERFANKDFMTALRELWAELQVTINEKVIALSAWLRNPENAKEVADAFVAFLGNAFNVAGRVQEAVMGFYKAVTQGMADFFGQGGAGREAFSAMAAFINNLAVALTDPQSLERIYEAAAKGGEMIVDGIGDMGITGINLLRAFAGLVAGIAEVAVAVVKNAPAWLKVAGAFISGFVAGIISEVPRKAKEVWDHFWSSLKGGAEDPQSGKINLSWMAEKVLDWVKSHNWGEVSLEILTRVATFGLAGMKDLENGWKFISDSIQKWVEQVEWGRISLEILTRIATVGLVGVKDLENGWNFIMESLQKWIDGVNWAAVALDILIRIATFNVLNLEKVQNGWGFIKESISSWVGSVSWSDVAGGILGGISSAVASAKVAWDNLKTVVKQKIQEGKDALGIGGDSTPSRGQTYPEEPWPDDGDGATPVFEGPPYLGPGPGEGPGSYSEPGDSPGGSFVGPPYMGPGSQGDGGQGGAGGAGKNLRMADGGVFRARPGGHDVRVKAAEAGKDEAFLPLDPALFRRLGLGGGGPVTVHTHVYLDGREIAQDVKEILIGDVKMQKQLAF